MGIDFERMNRHRMSVIYSSCIMVSILAFLVVGYEVGGGDDKVGWENW